MLRAFAMVLVMSLVACGDDDGGGSGTGGVSGAGGLSGEGATGGSGGVSGSSGSGGGSGSSGSGGGSGSSGSGGAGGSDAATDCPSQMPADQTPCATQGLLCFYAGGALVDMCMACAEWPCSEQMSECNGQWFAHVDRTSCDGGIEDAGTLDATTDAASMVSDAGVDANVIDANVVDATVIDSDVADAGNAVCRAGHYVGSMSGTYTTTAWGNGQTPLALQTESSPGAPGLDLWFAQATTPCAPSAAFCPDLEVTMGIAHFVVAVPGLAFDAVVTGALDCRTGEFRGNLAANGILGSLSFSGPMLASYDAAQPALTNGTWSVTDNATPCSGCGGNGTWSAMWVDSPWNDEDAGAITDASVVVDAAVVSDAGTSSPCAGGEICRTSSIAMGYLQPGQGFCAPDNNSDFPPVCSGTNQPCGPSGGTCLSLGVCLRVCDLPN